MVTVRQGDVFWAELGPAFGSEPASRRPVVVVQCDLFNARRINTVVVVPCTTNLELGSIPGNVTIRKGEARLLRKCIAVSTHVSAIDRTRLLERIGSLPGRTLSEVLDGIDLVLRGIPAVSA